MRFYEILFIFLLLISFAAFLAMLFGKLPYKGSIVFLVIVFSVFVFSSSAKFKEISAGFAGGTLKVVNDKYKEIVEIDEKLSDLSFKMVEVVILYMKERGRWGTAYINIDKWDSTLRSLTNLSTDNTNKKNELIKEVDDLIGKMRLEKNKKEAKKATLKKEEQ